MVAESEAAGGPPEGVQSLASFQSPLTPFQVNEAIGFIPVWPMGREKSEPPGGADSG
jgi:hypothetical protein